MIPLLPQVIYVSCLCVVFAVGADEAEVVFGAVGGGFGVTDGSELGVEVREHTLVFGVGGEVIAFLGVLVNVEEGGAFVVVVDIFVWVSDEHVPGVAEEVAVVFGEGVFRFVIALDGGEPGVAGVVGFGVETGDVHDGGIHVDEGDGVVDLLALGKVGAGDDERDADRAFVGALFVKEAVFA